MKKLFLLTPLVCFLFAACVTKRPIDYAWGDYSKSLYKLKKGPTDERLQSHKEVLVRIITDSKENSWRVPPGIYAEYGYILLSEGKTSEGLANIELEAATYPESRVFMERIKAQAIQKPAPVENVPVPAVAPDPAASSDFESTHEPALKPDQETKK